jgi:hypothetical protein
MCYYLNLRFNSVNKSFERISLKNNYNEVRVEELKLILREHNSICITVEKYNDFWRIVLLSDALIHTFFVLVMIYLAFFSPNLLWIRIFFSTLALMFMSCLIFVIISAASVSTQVCISFKNWQNLRKNVKFLFLNLLVFLKFIKGSQILCIIEYYFYQSK